MTLRLWSNLIAGVALIAVATAAAATLEHSRARSAQTAAPIAACDTNYDLASAPAGDSISVTTVTCKRPAAPIVSSPL